jgi:hypothetical protein
MPTAYQAGVTSALTHYLKAVQAAGTTDEALGIGAGLRRPVPVEAVGEQRALHHIEAEGGDIGSCSRPRDRPPG